MSIPFITICIYLQAHVYINMCIYICIDVYVYIYDILYKDSFS